MHPVRAALHSHAWVRVWSRVRRPPFCFFFVFFWQFEGTRAFAVFSAFFLYRPSRLLCCLKLLLCRLHRLPICRRARVPSVQQFGSARARVGGGGGGREQQTQFDRRTGNRVLLPRSVTHDTSGKGFPPFVGTGGCSTHAACLLQWRARGSVVANRQSTYLFYRTGWAGGGFGL